MGPKRRFSSERAPSSTSRSTPLDAARAAIRGHSSFDLVDTAHGLKVDLFVLGDGLLDRMQSERRMNVSIPGFGDGIWVTSPEDPVLRKLDLGALLDEATAAAKARCSCELDHCAERAWT